MERRNYLKTICGLGIVTGLAGCTAEPGRSEKIDHMFKAHAWLSVGEGIGAEENGDEHWKVMVTELDDDGVDIEAEKIVADEVGQNKEGIDPTYTFERVGVSSGDLAVIENDFRVGVIEIKDGKAHIGVDDYTRQSSLNEVSR